jgi:hypothetical protein
MRHTIIETQLPNANGKSKKRLYVLDGPEFQTILSFWNYLVQTGVIEDYSIYKGDIK